MILTLSPQSYRWRRFSPGRESLWWWYQTMVLNMLARNLRGFSKSWNFHHYTSSPHHPKGNGTAEAALKQAKRILKMSHDPWMAILEQRNTPDELASPNEKLNSRRTRTVIPVKSELLEPLVIPTSSIIRASVKKKQQNKRYHNKKGKPLHPLVVGDSSRHDQASVVAPVDTRKCGQKRIWQIPHSEGRWPWVQEESVSHQEN